MFKKRLVTLILIFSACILVLMACSKNSAVSGERNTEGTTRDDVSNPDGLMGGENNPKLKLEASEIKDSDIDYGQIIPVDKVLEKDSDYKDIYDSMTDSISELCKNSEEFSLYGETGFYISKTPIRHFDVRNLKMQEGMSTQICIFSEDLSSGAVYILYEADGEILGQCNFSMNTYVSTIMKDNPEKDYIFLFNDGELLLIDSDNEITTDGNFNYEVSGDYYHALNYDLLSVSYNEMTREDNLIWVDVR